jgi:hypothetical protein
MVIAGRIDMSRLKTMMLVSLLPLLLAACAASSEQSLTLEENLAAKGYVIGEQVKRVQNWNLNGWSYVDDRNFIMNSGVRDKYLVTLRTPSYDLRSAINIAFSTTVGSLTDNDRVIVRTTGGMPQSFMIESLHRLGPGPASNESG